MAVGVPKPKPIPKNLSLEEQQQLVFHPEKNPTRYVAFEHATDYPFEPKAATWSRVNAWWLADASWLSYTQEAETVKAIFRDRAALPSCELIAKDGTECYLAHGADFAIAAFRGTQPDDWNDVLNDVMFQSVAWDEGHVHRGFARGLDVVREPLGQALKALPARCRVWFTGHSLGAALATLAAYRYRDVAAGVYTFGSPLVGNGVFAGRFDSVFEERSLRYVNDHDAVTHVPPEPFALPHGLYTHVDHLRWITKDGQIATTPPTLAHFVRVVFGRSNALLDIVGLHLADARISLPAALADHTPLYYGLHCWNDFALHVPAS